MEYGLFILNSTVVSSRAAASFSMVKSLTELVSLSVLYVNATSSAVSFSPSVNDTSSRMVTVQVSPSSLASIPVARSYPIFRSVVVTVNVLWIKGSCT